MNISGTTQQEANIKPKKKKQKIYWTQETEDAVKKFLEMDTRFIQKQMDFYLKNRKKTFDSTMEDGQLMEFKEKLIWSETKEIMEAKNKIYKRSLETPLNRLVENIIYTYKLFRFDIDVKTAHNDCLGHIHEKFSNFDPYSGKKSYSYYGTVAKNYCMNAIKNLKDNKPRLLDYEDHKPEVDSKRIETINEDVVSKHKEEDIMIDLFHYIKDLLEDEILKEDWKKNDLKTKNDIKVAKALVYILNDHENINAYNKVDIFKEIEEETGLAKKDITYSLTRIRVFYREKKEKFIKKRGGD